MRTIPKSRNVYLTFDDGPDPTGTPRVLDLLKKEKVKATFFVVAEKVECYPELVRRILEEGHAIGNHSLDHRYAPYFQNVEKTKKWIEEARKKIENIAGKKTVGFRPPAGVRTPVIHRALKELQVPLWYWSQRYFDTQIVFDPKRAEKKAVQVRGGDIILFHDRQREKFLPIFLSGLEIFIQKISKREQHSQEKIEFAVLEVLA